MPIMSTSLINCFHEFFKKTVAYLSPSFPSPLRAPNIAMALLTLTTITPAILASCEDGTAPYGGDYEDRLKARTLLSSADLKKRLHTDRLTSLRQNTRVAGVRIKIATMLYAKIFQGTKYQQPIRITITHPTDTWVIQSYFVGGQVRNNPAALDQRTELIFNEPLARSSHFITLIIRNMSLCKATLTDEQQCTGKHSLRPISNQLETYFLVPIQAAAEPSQPPERLPADAVEDIPITPDQYAQMLQLLLDGCTIDKSHFKLKLNEDEQLRRAMPDWIDFISNTGKRNAPEAIINVAEAIETMSTTQTAAMKKTERSIDQQLEQCINNETQWLETNYGDKVDEVQAP